MADPAQPRASDRMLNITHLENAAVRVTGDHRLQVEFRIDDLVKKLLPNGTAVGHCGGCNGCMGCSM